MPDSQNSKSSALVAIDFHGDQIVTFQHNSEAYVTMRRVVENIGLAWQVQQRKLAESGDRFACHHMVTHDSSGRRQSMLAMPVSKLPLWLATINPNKIPDPVKRAKIELYQAESAIALHDYWTKGVAIRGDMEGLVTQLDPAVMKAIGGMLKGIVQKALTDLREPLGDAALLSQHAAVNRGYTAGEVLDEAGVTDRRGMRSVINRVSHSIRRYAAEKHMLVGMGRLGSSKAYVFDGSLVRVWLRDGGGKQMIDRLVAERSGQGALRLAFNKG
ncbi:MAG TPA: phage antirepressor N-terminal domain-containing protein [Candidatus Sphingomonas excrementigallinarum]|nr:phage antirepressor N-terminal domain-containing protein [Candidatus Sphingomonas excrementigallinarum]